MRSITKVIVHHSASPRDTTTTEMIRDWHVNGNGWDDIGYHWVIEADGSLHKGRLESVVGAHCRGHNGDSIGVCVVGDFASGEPTGDQVDTLRGVIAGLLGAYPGAEVLPHSDLGSTQCPGALLDSLQDSTQEGEPCHSAHERS